MNDNLWKNQYENSLNVTKRYTRRRWLSDRADSGARGPGFKSYDRRIVSLSKII